MTTIEDFEEIYLERLRYLASMDDMMHEMLEDQQSVIYDIQASQDMNQVARQDNDIRVEAESASA
jgi:hypothetical protein